MLRVVEHFERSDTGRARRNNEDALFARPPLFAIADGMGGAQAGEVAARIAVEALEPGMPGDGAAEQELADLAREANRRIIELSHSDDRHAGMGTTLTAAYVGENEVALAHVGDSRGYVLRDGRLLRLTKDHTLVEELRNRGKLTEEEAEDHPQRSIITRALGAERDLAVDTRSYAARDGDVFLLCSDGLTGMVREERIAELLTQADSLSSGGRALIDAANEAGGRDNITVVLFRIEEIEPRVGSAATGEAAVIAPPDEETDPHGEPVAEEELAEPAEEAAAEAEPEPVVAPEPEPEPARPAREIPAAPARPVQPKRGGLLRRLRILGFVVIIGLPLVGGAWAATRAVYFLGTDDHGVVTVYRGVPYELPAGIELYASFYETGVGAAALSPAQRERLLDHQLRSHDDAIDLARALERGEIAR